MFSPRKMTCNGSLTCQTNLAAEGSNSGLGKIAEFGVSVSAEVIQSRKRTKQKREGNEQQTH